MPSFVCTRNPAKIDLKDQGYALRLAQAVCLSINLNLFASGVSSYAVMVVVTNILLKTVLSQN